MGAPSAELLLPQAAARAGIRESRSAARGVCGGDLSPLEYKRFPFGSTVAKLRDADTCGELAPGGSCRLVLQRAFTSKRKPGRLRGRLLPCEP